LGGLIPKDHSVAPKPKTPYTKREESAPRDTSGGYLMRGQLIRNQSNKFTL